MYNFGFTIGGVIGVLIVAICVFAGLFEPTVLIGSSIGIFICMVLDLMFMKRK